MPRTLVQSLVEVIDACVEGIPYVPLDEANMQARGLGSMVAFWEQSMENHFSWQGPSRSDIAVCEARCCEQHGKPFHLAGAKQK